MTKTLREKTTTLRGNRKVLAIKGTRMVSRRSKRRNGVKEKHEYH